MKRGVAVAAMVLLACTGTERVPPELAVEITDSAGVTLVANRGAVPTPPASEGLAIGGDESRPETLFGYVADVAVDSVGGVYVLDQYAREVRVFGLEGDFLHTVGGPGDGPGELSRFAASLVLRGDTLLVADWARRGVHLFHTDGTFLEFRAFPGAPGARSWWRQGPGGDLFFRALERVVREDGRWGGRDLLLRVGEAWEEPDTVFEFRYEESDLGGPERVLAPLLVNSPMWAPLPGGGFAWGTLDGTRVRIHGPDGSLERIVSHDAWTRRPPTPGEEEAMVGLLGDKMVMMGGERSVVNQIEVVQPEALPALTSLATGSDGRIWVQRMGGPGHVHPMSLNTPDPPVGWGGGTWDVLGSEGRSLATFHLPDRFRMMRVVDGAVYGVRRDGLGRETVVRIRVEAGGLR